MDFALLPPEVNSGRMYTGPGSAPMLAAAAAWDALAAELQSAASGYSAVISGLTGQAWSGPTSMTMAAAAGLYAAWLHATAAQAEHTAAQAKAAAAAYQAAFAMTVPPPVIAANRALLTVLIATNFFGHNTPAIAATEAHYAQMWAQDATAMYGYAGASASASTLPPFSPPSPTTNSSGHDAQAAAVAHAIGSATSARTPIPLQLTSTLHAARQQLTSALGSSSAPTTQTSVLSELGTLLDAPSLAGNTGSNTFFLGANLDTVLSSGLGWGKEAFVAGGLQGYVNTQALGPLHALSGLAEPSVGLGKAASLGTLSVPPSWATAAEIQPTSLSLPATCIDAAPAIATGMPPGFTFQQALMGTMTGRRAATEAATRKKAHNDDTDPKDQKNGKSEPERPVAHLVSAVGWLASSAAHHSRRRRDA